MGTLLVIGTGKGLFIASRDDGRRTWSAPHRTAGAARLGVAAAGTLRAVLDEVGTRWPRLDRRIRDEQGEVCRYVNVYVDGADCRLADGQDTPVADGGEV